ncbi:hypothetical protein SDC9_204282 [bioreactor metagenome]|uniref:Uncharacterized protein n=1 Tax=bioreactor metagenome TaxID=1076179 RepID=A0A645J0G9_9ZZZZ
MQDFIVRLKPRIGGQQDRRKGNTFRLGFKRGDDHPEKGNHRDQRRQDHQAINQPFFTFCHEHSGCLTVL